MSGDDAINTSVVTVVNQDMELYVDNKDKQS